MGNPSFLQGPPPSHICATSIEWTSVYSLNKSFSLWGHLRILSKKQQVPVECHTLWHSNENVQLGYQWSQKLQGLAEVRPAWAWLAEYMNVSHETYSNLNISPKMSYSVCLSVMLSCYRITHLWFGNKRFCNKKGVLLVPDPIFKFPEKNNSVSPPS